MAAVDSMFTAIVRANAHLRPRVGNPDEMRSNRLLKTLEQLKFRVTDPEQSLLNLKVCDPASGSGHFLVAAARRISKKLPRRGAGTRSRRLGRCSARYEMWWGDVCSAWT